MIPRSRKGWKSKADKLWSLYVRKRDPICRWCKDRKAKNAHHIISRRYHSTRFMTACGVGLCPACHFKAHQNPIAAHEWLVAEVGAKHLELLNTVSQGVEKLDYPIICYNLETQLELLKG